MAKTPKRRLVTQLPAILQTDTLKNFFAATVDHLFQPGASESISGYIGEKPVYYNPDKDFYLAEPTAARTAYQLEPAMISVNSGGILTDSLCYDDLINYIRSQGGIVNNHSRMFEGDYYSWAPPVDLDKLNNYLQYVWMGSLTEEENEASSIVLRAPRAIYSYDGNAATTAYALPPAITAFAGAGEDPLVLLNGVNISHQLNTTGDVIISTSGLVVGDVIETIRYGDLTKAFDGVVTLDYSPFLAWTSTETGFDDTNTYVLNLPRQYKAGELAYGTDDNNFSAVYVCIQDHTAAGRFGLELQFWQLANNGTEATTGSRVRLIDGIGTTLESARPFFVDGVGEAINLTSDFSDNSGGSAPHYIVIDRRSRENSPWARRNLWVHEQTLQWTGDDFTSRRAQRPIIEFLPNIELYNYGTRRLPDVQGVLSNTTAEVIDNFDLTPYDDNVWDQAKIELSRINGQFFSRANPDDETVVGSVVVDNGYVLQPNDLLFVHQAVSDEPVLNNLIYRVVSNPDTPVPYTDVRADVIELVLNGQPQRGDVVRVAQGDLSVFADQVEYWFNGSEWVIAQNGADVPLFMLYDSSENSLADDATFPGTDFTGSRLFGYLIGTGLNDPVLGFPITVNSFAQPVFEIDPVVERVTYASGEVLGYYYHHFINDDGSSTFSNNWFAVAEPSTQALVDGVYEIPLNLQANPGNLEVKTISRSQWFDHFSSIMTSQVGFTGHPYSVNNWRDTAKVLGTGNKILQHRSPLLKTMLISADTNYDLPASMRYAEQEYSRYRNKFIQAILDLRTSGTLTELDPPSQWVDTILNQLRLNKNSSFPFFGSTMAGGQYFIPPTPASMGLDSVTIPASVLNTTLANVKMIRGHDGSQIPAFGQTPSLTFTSFDAIYDIGQTIGEFEYLGSMNVLTVSLNSTLLTTDQYDIENSGSYLRIFGTVALDAVVEISVDFGDDHTHAMNITLDPSQRTGPVLDLGTAPDGFTVVSATVTPTPPSTIVYNIVDSKWLHFSSVLPDGSTVTVDFTDLRDSTLLAFEQRVYDNIPAQFKTEARPVFDFDQYVIGAFNTDDGLDYTTAEINQMLLPYFQRWAQVNFLDFRQNTGYDPSNPFTWNFSSSIDRKDQPVPGNWRGIYLQYFDTYTPQITPWEMLGFVDKPVWWQSEYGPAPYTSGNTKLWDDLRDGVIRGGVREGTDARYARPDLDAVLPVDEEGNLLNPIQCGIIIEAPSYQQATAPWVAGDVGPIEALWRLSPSYGFAQAQVNFLIKPARYVEQGWDTLNLKQDDTGQWIYTPTGNRPLDSELFVHGELLSNGSRAVAQGVQQWISDYMVSRGQDPANFGSAVRGLDVRLAHKMAGFTTSDDLKIMADNFGLVPAEDISIALYHSPSTREEVYSGVVIEWTGVGWRVIGYDTRTPTFFTIPGLEAGPKGIITLATSPEPVINAWRPNVYYTIGTNVAIVNTVYTCIKGHTSGQTFDQQFWTVASALPTQAPRVTTYLRAGPDMVEVPYGTVFHSTQEVANFLLSLERYYVAHGWVFDKTDTNTQEPLNWSLAVREFLAWSQVNWQPGNFIALSPGSEGLRFIADQGMIMDVLSPANGVYGMIDRSGAPIHRENVVVNRVEAEATLLSKNYDVFGGRINIGEIEHILIFDNTTIFNDIIYAPLFNLRQPRLRVIGRRSTNWTGRLDAPGFMIIDGQIKSNFDKAATDLLTMWDIEKADNATLRNHARHVVGYDSRDYLANLVLSETEQFEFYQGLIHQKGAPGAFDKLLRSDFIEQSRDLQFFEEWAIKIDEYGAVDSRQRTSFLFGDSTIKRDPQYVEFRVLDANSPAFTTNLDLVDLTDSTITGVDPKWIERPNDPLNTFPQRTTPDVRVTDFPAAGYVRLDEINQTVFSAEDIPTVYNPDAGVTLTLGQTVWIHKNDNQRDISPATSVDWFVLGTDLGSGHWDATNNTTTLANTYTVVGSDGERVFRSHPNDAPFVSDSSEFIPIPGETYKVTFNVRKIVRETNGIQTFVRPAFDAFKANSITNALVVDGGLGVKEGIGYSKVTDLIDTSAWVLGQFYEVSAEWTAPSSPNYLTARGRIRINRTYPDDMVTTPYSDAIFEVESQNMAISKVPSWDVLKVYNLSADGNTNSVANVVTNAEDLNVDNTTTRIFTVTPHGLATTDRGLYVIIDGDTFSNPNVQGVAQIWDVGDGYFDLLTTGEQGFDFVGKGQQGPALRLMRSIHFQNITEFNSSKTRVGLQDGDIAYVDGSPWRVYQRSSITELTDDYADGSPQPNNQVFVPDDNNRRTIDYTFWQVARSQPLRMDADRIASSLIYDLKTKITTTDLQPEPLSLDHLTVVAPLSGVIPGRAKAEIDFALDYDPARYNTIPSGRFLGGTLTFASTGSPTNLWGPAQVGRVWWDLSTVRFLETETDNVQFGLSNNDRYNAETRYRVRYWGQIAPATSVDVYEWVRSTLAPLDYQAAVATDTTDTFVGEIYNPENPSWVQTNEFDASAGSVIPIYYFWVKNRDTIPPNTNRQMAVNTVAQFITNPMIEDQPWIAPIMPNGVLVGGANPFLDDTFEQDANAVSVSGTVLQIEVDDLYEGVTHDEWFLMRPEDERSLPPDWLWDKLRDSLVGFTEDKVSLPPPLTLPKALPTVNKPPVWYESPAPDALPITPPSS